MSSHAQPFETALSTALQMTQVQLWGSTRLHLTLLIQTVFGRAGFLHDHRIRGQVLLPGAAMFEMSCAAASCMNKSSLPTLLLGVVISAPLVLEDPSSGKAGGDRLLTCVVGCLTGQLEIRSVAAASGVAAAAKHRGQLHLGGWAGQAAMPPATSSLSEQEAVRSPLSGLFSAVEEKLHLPTAVAGILPLPVGTCEQPGGYAVHPAVLDSATHTAAAFSDADASEKGTPLTAL